MIHKICEKERKRNAKRNARSYSEKGTEQERVHDFLIRKATRSRSQNLRNDWNWKVEVKFEPLNLRLNIYFFVFGFDIINIKVKQRKWLITLIFWKFMEIWHKNVEFLVKKCGIDKEAAALVRLKFKDRFNLWNKVVWIWVSLFSKKLN